MTCATDLGPDLNQQRPAGGRRIGSSARRLAVLSCAAAAFGLVATACGSVASSSGGQVSAGGPPATPGTSASVGTSASPAVSASPGTSAGSGTSGAAALVSLTATLYPANNGAPPAQFTLRCDPTGGTVADPAAACAQLLADPGVLAPPSGHLVCPMILASGSRVVVYGTYLGKQVNETIRDGGCDLSRWVVLRQVFG